MTCLECSKYEHEILHNSQVITSSHPLNQAIRGLADPCRITTSQSTSFNDISKQPKQQCLEAKSIFVKDIVKDHAHMDWNRNMFS